MKENKDNFLIAYSLWLVHYAAHWKEWSDVSAFDAILTSVICALNIRKQSTDGSTKSGFAGTCSQQDFTPLASTKPQSMNFML